MRTMAGNSAQYSHVDPLAYSSQPLSVSRGSIGRKPVGSNATSMPGQSISRTSSILSSQNDYLVHDAASMRSVPGNNSPQSNLPNMNVDSYMGNQSYHHSSVSSATGNPTINSGLIGTQPSMNINSPPPDQHKHPISLSSNTFSPAISRTILQTFGHSGEVNRSPSRKSIPRATTAAPKQSQIFPSSSVVQTAVSTMGNQTETSRHMSKVCESCKADLTTHNNYFECLDCIFFKQKTILCVPCFTAMAPHHHDRSKFATPYDKFIPDATYMVPGWHARLNPSGMVYYQHAVDPTAKTFQRPSIQNVAAHMEPQSSQINAARLVTPATGSQNQHRQAEAIQASPKPVLTANVPYSSGVLQNQGNYSQVPGQLSVANRTTEAYVEIPRASQQAELPPGWSEIRTPEGRIFYTNVETQESTWITPQKEIPLPLGWEERHDPDGRIFYFSPVTRLATWTRPAGSKVSFPGKRPEARNDPRPALESRISAAVPELQQPQIPKITSSTDVVTNATEFTESSTSADIHSPVRKENAAGETQQDLATNIAFIEDDEQATGVQQATSINMGKAPVRRISVRSVGLLDVKHASAIENFENTKQDLIPGQVDVREVDENLAQSGSLNDPKVDTNTRPLSSDGISEKVDEEDAHTGFGGHDVHSEENEGTFEIIDIEADANEAEVMPVPKEENLKSKSLLMELEALELSETNLEEGNKLQKKGIIKHANDQLPVPGQLSAVVHSDTLGNANKSSCEDQATVGNQTKSAEDDVLQKTLAGSQSTLQSQAIDTDSWVDDIPRMDGYYGVSSSEESKD